jgi:hypothetical protein
MGRALRHAASLGMVAWFAAQGAVAQAPACGAEITNARRAQSARYTVAYRTTPAIIEVSRHFAMELAVCAKADAPEPEALRISARMPEHGHGMNYKPTITLLGGGRFHADGLLFHMPGRWQFEFEVDSGKASDRVFHDFMLR